MMTRTGGNVLVKTGTPLQCLDCSSRSSGGKCVKYPDGIPGEKRDSLCIYHEYRLRLR